MIAPAPDPRLADLTAAAPLQGLADALAARTDLPLLASMR